MIDTAVTGATGFVGRVLLPALCNEGAQIRALVRPGGPAALAAEVRVECGGLHDSGALAALVRGADCVIHLAGYAHTASKPSAAELERHRHINLEGTQNLFRAAAAAGVRRFVFVSSVKAGGEHRRDCLHEHSPQRPADPYGIIKRQTEDWLFEQGERAGVEICVLRPALVYGPGVKGNLAALLRAIDRGRFPPVPETGNIRSMVGVHDLVAALLAARCRTEAAGQLCIVEDGEAYSTRRIFVAMARALGRPVPSWSVPAAALRVLGRIGDVGELIARRPLPFNSTLAARLLESACYRSVQAPAVLGFQPRQRLEDALPAMIAAYRAGAPRM